MSVAPSTVPESKRHRPKWLTVFAAAFVAGATAAVGVNSFLDVHLSQRKPQVECEPIFVALRSLPQGAPVTVWDVALKDWPKAMLPASALRAHDSFDGFVLRHAVREGQPLLAVQLVRADGASQHRATAADESFTAPVPASQQPAATSTQTDLWAPAESIGGSRPAPQTRPEPKTTVAAVPPASAKAAAPAATAAVPTKPAPASTDIDPPAQVEPEQAVAATPPTTTPPTIPTTTPPAAPAAEAVVTSEPPAAAPASEPAAPPARLDTKTASAPPAPAPVAPSPTEVDSPALAATQPAVGEPTPAPDIASMPSVVVPEQDGRTTQAKRPAASPSGRYLVVPERIALQADTSFAAPRRPQPTTSAPQQRGKPSSARPATGSRRGESQRSQQQPQQRSALAPSAGQRTWGSFFPNIAAGMEALGGQSQRTRSPADQKAPARR